MTMRSRRTCVLTNGTQVSVYVQAEGPNGFIGGTAEWPVLYLYEQKHGRYWCDPTCYSADDVYALLKRIMVE